MTAEISHAPIDLRGHRWRENMAAFATALVLAAIVAIGGIFVGRPI